MGNLISEFKSFLLRGNLVDLAVAIVIGVAFGAVINALVKDIVTPVIAAIAGKPDFSNLTFTINKSRFLYGDFINALITFLTVAAAIFFLVVRPVNALIARYRKVPPPDPSIKKCPECLSDIPAGARRCSYCASEVPLAATA